MNTSRRFQKSRDYLPSKAFIGKSFDSAWLLLLDELYHSGAESNPRGHKTREKLNVQLRVENMLNNILVCEQRNPNYKFMVAEWLWIWFGMNDVETIARYNSRIAQFSDDGLNMAGAYGPRLVSQEAYVAKVLSNDRNTRQAVFTIFSPSPKPSKDIPCTLTLQIFTRENVVHATVNMRSSDVWLGLPYDFFTFSMFVNVFASKFMKDCTLGSMTFNLGSSHLYENDFTAADEVLAAADVAFIKSPVVDLFPPAQMRAFMREPDIGKIPALEPWRTYADVLRSPRAMSLKFLEKLA